MTKANPLAWLLFVYDVPDKPSRIKVRIWRQLKALGAVYPQMSFCILPDSGAVRSHLKDLTSILQLYGAPLVLRAKPVEVSHSRGLLKLFKQDAEKEYQELLEECDEFLDEIRKNLATGNVTQTEVSELEAALEGLERWFTRVKARDIAKPRTRLKVRRLLAHCHDALLTFSEKAQPKTPNQPQRSGHHL